MKLKSLIILAVAGLMATRITAAPATQPPKMKMTSDIPASITAPDRAETSIGTLEYFDSVPTEKTVEKVDDSPKVVASGNAKENKSYSLNGG